MGNLCSNENNNSIICPTDYIFTTDYNEAVVGPPNEGAGRRYICYNRMDDKNKKALDIQATQGWDAAIEHMMTGEDGKPRSYAEMRSLYG